jgi:hypothetical protein
MKKQDGFREVKSKEEVMKKFASFALLTLALLVASSAQAQTAPTGRWEFAVTSGDTTYQLENMGQTSFSTYLTLSGTTLTGNSQETTNTSLAELACCNDTVSGSYTTVKNVTTVTVTFAIPANRSTGQAAFNYVFTGTYNANPSNSGGPTITGTYTTTAGTTFSDGGNFTATWFPNFPSTPEKFTGSLDGPDTGSGSTDVATTIYLGTNSSNDLIGSVSVPGMTNASGVACFAGTLTIQTVNNSQVKDMGGATNGVGIPFASGVGINIFAQDSVGTQIWLTGYSAKPNNDSAAVGENYLSNTDTGSTETTDNGTNTNIILYYGISGGPCDGLGGGDAPFHPVVKTQRVERRRQRY